MLAHDLTAFLAFSFVLNVCHARPITAVAAQNLTNANFVGYVDDPAGRGTSSLVLSCLLTLVLCVWSALHLNVPPANRSRSDTFWTSVIWITAGIYAPELVVFTAWRQWNSAKILSQQIKARQHRARQEGRGTLMHPWTMTHSFFASTGGFAFDCSPYIYSSENLKGYLPPGTSRRLTITANGMSFLAMHGCLPDVPKEDIKDKSKADAMAETLVILQAAWMLLQVIGRLIEKVPITLLEVNTVAHM